MDNKKQRGQRRKLLSLKKNIEKFQPFQYIEEDYEHFHVPCRNDFINSKRTSGKIKTAFIKGWIATTEKFIEQKPSELTFCKVVSLICEQNLWDSQIIIFYSEDYYNSFWNRQGDEQKWTLNKEDHSLIQERNVQTKLKEVSYDEEIIDENEKFSEILWFYLE
ncbi:MAG: DUF3916 domain-containing protein [bacterium]|nr:DUF3916 domain-containing protein [bacterium]